jgi:hypothetical protein
MNVKPLSLKLSPASLKAALCSGLIASTFLIPLEISKANAFRVGAYMYKDANFGGSDFILEPNTQSSHLGWFNDKASSVRVARGCTLSVFYDSNFMGPSTSFSSGDYPFIGEYFNDRISSARVTCRS